ncbi:unnamed protein product [Cunninghamella blakesleeana]
MDGVVGVTQCGIPPNYTYTYEYNITQYGTYWIHSHYKGQYMDGLRAPLIFHNKNETYQYDEEKIITVSDWYHNQSEVNTKNFLSVHNPDGVEPVPQSGLINDNANTTFHFIPGKTYRLRFINMSGFSTFYLSIDNHTLDIIEVDGIETQRSPVDSIYLTAGQRISALVTAKNTTSLNFYLHADMDPSMFDEVPKNLKTNYTAPIYYDYNHENFSSSQDVGTSSTFDDFTLIPLIPSTNLPKQPDQSANLTFNFAVTNDGINRGMFNEVPYLPPNVPSLNTLLTIGANYTTNPKVYGPQSSAFVFKHNAYVELAITNLDNGAHPFHLHGYTFYMVGRGKGIWKGDYEDDQIEWSKNPIRRDTFLIKENSFILIRFYADNPGAWFFHCHIDWHLESGLAATIITAPELFYQQKFTLPQAIKDVCIAGNQSWSGNAAGKEGLDLDGAPNGIYIPNGKQN